MANKSLIIPPALWATGGLEAPQSRNPSIPSSLLPWGGVYPSPNPALKTPPKGVESACESIIHDFQGCFFRFECLLMSIDQFKLF